MKTFRMNQKPCTNHCLINPYNPNGISIYYQLERSTTNFRGVGCYFCIVFPNLNRTICKQTVETLIRLYDMWRLIWICTVCLCATQGTQCLYGLILFIFFQSIKLANPALSSCRISLYFSVTVTRYIITVLEQCSHRVLAAVDECTEYFVLYIGCSGPVVRNLNKINMLQSMTRTLDQNTRYTELMRTVLKV